MNESLNRLKKEINLNSRNDNQITTLTNQTQNNNQQVQINQPKNWTEEQVKTCLIVNNIITIFQILEPIDGANLFQMYEMKKHIPEFFF